MNIELRPFQICPCKDVSEKIDIHEGHHIYIKPIARVNISIHLPLPKNPIEPAPLAEITEKLRKQIAPEEFVTLRIIKHTIEFIRFEGEIENKSGIKNLINKLDNTSVKMSHAYMDVLKVKCAESKIVYPTRHEWDSFYQVQSQNVNEMRSGERPDTLHIQDMPVKWFADRQVDADRPSEQVIRDVFTIFGDIRAVEIPHMDKYGYKLTKNDTTFECLIQYFNYISFVKAMDTFRGMKFLFIENNDPKLACTACVRVDFDRSRRLSDREIQKRRIEGMKQAEVEKIKTAQMEKEREHQVKKAEIEKYRRMLQENNSNESHNDTSPNTSLTQNNADPANKDQRRREREEARRQKRLVKKQQEEETKLANKIALEERKILIAQRKLESMRLLEELFNRVKSIVAREELEKHEKEMQEDKEKKDEEEKLNEEAKRLKFEVEEKELQEKIERNLREQQELESKDKYAEMDEIDKQMAIDAELAKSIAQDD